MITTEIPAFDANMRHQIFIEGKATGESLRLQGQQNGQTDSYARDLLYSYDAAFRPKAGQPEDWEDQARVQGKWHGFNYVLPLSVLRQRTTGRSL